MALRVPSAVTRGPEWNIVLNQAHPQFSLIKIKCHICGQPILMMDLHESAAIPAHKECVKYRLMRRS